MPTTTRSVTQLSTELPTVGLGYRRYALTMLMLTLVLSLLDRQVINILAEPIKQELGLADWQIGLMTGFAFAIFYTSFGIPIARQAERKNRPLIISGALACWSLATVACGYTQTFAQLLLARVGVGVGEAGCTPPAHSLISDYYPREKRASALAFYHVGVPIGVVIGLAMGGVIADNYGWRTAFLVAGAPGLVFAAIVAATLREPRKALPAARAAALHADQPTLKDTLRYLARKRSFWFMSLGAALKAFVAYAHVPFVTAFFLRVHGQEIADGAARFGLKSVGFLGLTMGAIGGFGAVFGTFLGGQLADRAARRDARAYCTIPAVAALVAMPLAIAGFLAPSAGLAALLLTPPLILNSLWYGPVFATAQSIVPPAMRATTSAILLFILNLIGLGLGPLSVGILSDVLARGAGLGAAEGVRWALVASCLLALAASALFWTARRTLREDIEG